MAGADGVTVVKLGGSFAGDPSLPQWLAALARYAGRIVVVPGGGPFADAVRAAQPKIGFDDRAAHRMALLAMEQFGCAIVSHHQRFRLASSPTALRRTMAEGAIPVWAPARMVLCAREIPASWDVTSDSLAVWLAGKLGADRLLLVKQVALGTEPAGLDALVSRGVVDAAFPGFLERSRVAAFVLGPLDLAMLGPALDGVANIGVRISSSG